MLPAARLPFPPPDWYRDKDHDLFKDKRVPNLWPWQDVEPMQVRPVREAPLPERRN